MSRNETMRVAYGAMSVFYCSEWTVLMVVRPRKHGGEGMLGFNLASFPVADACSSSRIGDVALIRPAVEHELQER